MIGTGLSPERIDVRRKHIGSSEIAALFGLSERCTPFELWHMKAGNLPEPDLSDDQRVFWGTVLEPAIAQGIALQQGWKVRKVRRYIEHPSVPGLGASVDFEVVSSERGPGVLEIKAVDRFIFKSWMNEQPPIAFELQVQHQLACLPRRTWGALGVLIGGNEPRVFTYDRHPGAIARIEAKVAEFWASIDAGQEPSPDFASDAAAISALYSEVAAGKSLDLREDQRLAELCQVYSSAQQQESAAEARKKAAKAEILTVIEDAERAVCRGFRVHAPTREGGPVSYVRKAYRDFRIYPLSDAPQEG